MEAQAPRLPAGVPLLMIVGDRDPAYGHARSSWYAPAARNPYSRYITVNADHVATPAVASKQIIDWINGLPR